MSTREQNERKFPSWRPLDDGGREYWLKVPGRNGWSARYVKRVDQNEQTISFWQEIRDGDGKLVEIHEKFPVDRGHRKV